MDGLDGRRIKIMKKFKKFMTELFTKNLGIKAIAIALAAFVVIVINMV